MKYKRERVWIDKKVRQGVSKKTLLNTVGMFSNKSKKKVMAEKKLSEYQYKKRYNFLANVYYLLSNEGSSTSNSKKNRIYKANRERYKVENRLENDVSLVPYMSRETRVSSLKEADKVGRNIGKEFQQYTADKAYKWKNYFNVYDLRKPKKHKMKSRKKVSSGHFIDGIYESDFAMQGNYEAAKKYRREMDEKAKRDGVELPF